MRSAIDLINWSMLGLDGCATCLFNCKLWVSACVMRVEWKYNNPAYILYICVMHQDKVSKLCALTYVVWGTAGAQCRHSVQMSLWMNVVPAILGIKMTLFCKSLKIPQGFFFYSCLWVYTSDIHLRCWVWSQHLQPSSEAKVLYLKSMRCSF